MGFLWPAFSRKKEAVLIQENKGHKKPVFLHISQATIFSIDDSPLIIFAKTFHGRCLTLSLPVPRWVGDNTDLNSNRNISKTIRINIVFKMAVFKEYSIIFLMVFRLIDFALVVLKLLMFKVCRLTGTSKIEKKKKIKSHSKPPNLVSQLLSK